MSSWNPRFWMAARALLFLRNEPRISLHDYKTGLYRQDDGSWVAEFPAIPGCSALLNTWEKALEELSHVFEPIAREYWGKELPLPAETTEITHANRAEI